MRYLANKIIRDLDKKMVFLGGPRQVGKTTLAKWILENYFPNGCYLNWDYREDRDAIINEKWPENCELLVFDELHKYPKWKNWLKGLYDKRGHQHRFLITGSARMDIYKKGGDSLMGRYHYWRLHPFSLEEAPVNLSPPETVERLLIHGGFPEPFTENNERETRRWRRERFDRILREDIRDLEMIHNLQMLSLFIDNLRKKVSSNLAFANIARDLEISPKTAKNWMSLAENLYMLFTIYPFSSKLTPRAITKPPKVYFYDNGDVLGEDGAIFENFVASHLKKKLNYLEDEFGYRYELQYIRDKEGREVDFIIVKDGQPEELIEVKLSDEKPSKGLIYYAEKLNIPKSTMLIKNLRQPYKKNGLYFEKPQTYFSGSYSETE